MLQQHVDYICMDSWWSILQVLDLSLCFLLKPFHIPSRTASALQTSAAKNSFKYITTIKTSKTLWGVLTLSLLVCVIMKEQDQHCNDNSLQFLYSNYIQKGKERNLKTSPQKLFFGNPPLKRYDRQQLPSQLHPLPASTFQSSLHKKTWKRFGKEKKVPTVDLTWTL